MSITDVVAAAGIVVGFVGVVLTWDQPAAVDTYWRNYHALTALEQIVGKAKVEVL